MKVEVRLLTGVDEKKFLFTAQQQKKHKLGRSTLTDQMKTFILSINNVDDPVQISDFVDYVW